MRVFVKNMREEPLMPCSNQKARKLLKDSKAKIYQYNPFTIQLMIPTGEATQPINIGIDTGAKMIGVAITTGTSVVAKGEIEMRQDISKNVRSRASLRHARRCHNTRYRECKILNRVRKSGWLPPSVQSRLNATIFWINQFCSLVPNPLLSIEVAKFDITKMVDPSINCGGYQNGQTKGYYDVRYFVFARDNYTCQVCKKLNKILQTHHILYRSKGGTDRADNQISVCIDCHTSENHKPGGILYEWMIKQKRVLQYKEPTFMNVVRKRIYKLYPNARVTYGSETSVRRNELGLSKSHYNDAIAISGINSIRDNLPCSFYYKQFRKKKRSLHESVPRKGKLKKNTTSSRNNKNVKYRNGYYLNDQVIYNGKNGWVSGYSGGAGGKEFLVRDIDGSIIKMDGRKNSISINGKHLKLVRHNNGWQFFERQYLVR